VVDDERERRQLRVIRDVTETLRAARIEAWLFGGWGLDAQIGKVTRSHGDVEFWVDRADAAASRTALISAGAIALDMQPAGESCEFVWDDAAFSTGYSGRQPDGCRPVVGLDLPGGVVRG
jgi:Aminoglycoside-2''-adenylyltransferase